MGVKARGRAAVMSLMVLVIGASAAGSGWAQSPYPDEPPSKPGLSGTQVLATVAAAIGSFFYIPFKAVAICPGMALASGASLALTRGGRDTAEYYLRVGCTGTYLITPEMIRGQEDFQGSGYPEPDTSMPMTGYR